MKALSACLYCSKKKDCAESVQKHSYLDSCFEAEEETVRAAVKDLQVLSKITLPVEVFEKTNKVAELLVNQAQQVKKLAKKIITDGCPTICLHGGPCPYDNNENVGCFNCEDPCPCRDCWDGEQLKIDWRKINEA